jgi:hypothetical protein
MWRLAVEEQKNRLGEAVNWFPYPAFIALGLISVFFGHLLFDLNPRIRIQADVISFDSDMGKDGGIWLSIYLKGENIVVETDDRQQFSIPINMSQDDKSMSALTDYLKQAAVDASVDVVLRSQIDSLQASVTIAADQHLKYIHLRPIFAAMAQAGISRYAFETRMLLSDVSTEADGKL